MREATYLAKTVRFWLLTVGIALAGCAVLLHSYVISGVPYTHDGENHLARFANYAIAVKEGQFPPRFAPNLLNHYGYPVFNYNYPLANILSLPLTALGVHYELSFKILVFLAVFIGSLGVATWLKRLRFGSTSIHITQLSYIFNPVLVNNVYYRGNIGEVISLALACWLLAFVTTSDTSKKRHFLLVAEVLLWSAFFLSHNILVLLITPLLLLYMIVAHWKNARAITEKFASFLLGLGTALWFWLPALLEKNQIVLGGSSLFGEVGKHVVQVNQLLFTRFHFGYSLSGSVDSLDLSFSIIGTISVGIFLFYWLKYKKIQPVVTFSGILVVVLLLAQLPFCKVLWNSVPLASYVQFPWRLLMPATLFSLPVIAFASGIHKTIAVLLMSILSLLAITIARLQPLEYLHKPTIEYELFAQTTSTQNENLTREFTYLQIGDWQPKPTIIGSGETVVREWTGSKRLYTLDLASDSIIIEPTMLFSGWQTLVDGKKTAYSTDEALEGRLGYAASSGHHEVISRFTQWTPARILGSLLSFGSFIFSGIFVIKNKASHE